MEQNKYKYETKDILKLYIDRMPIIICILAAIITGLICHKNNTRNETYIKMFTSMLIFGAISFYARYMLNKVFDDLMEAKKNSGQEEVINKSTINLKADDTLDINSILKNEDNEDDEDDFSPLTASKVISKQMNKETVRK